MISARKQDGIVLAIGQGTTELVVFDNMKPTIGRSIPQACDFVYMDGMELDYLHQDKAKTEPKRVEMLADIISESLASFRADLTGKKEYDVIVSGGGVLLPKMLQVLEKKCQIKLQTVEKPVFANALGMLEYSMIAIPSLQSHGPVP